MIEMKHSEISEKSIEAYLVKRVKEMGGVALKYFNPNMVGYPDRIVLLPKGRVIWVELKSFGKKPRGIQLVRIQHLKDLGFSVHVADSKSKVDEILKDYEKEIHTCHIGGV